MKDSKTLLREMFDPHYSVKLKYKAEVFDADNRVDDICADVKFRPFDTDKLDDLRKTVSSLRIVGDYEDEDDGCIEHFDGSCNIRVIVSSFVDARGKLEELFPSESSIEDIKTKCNERIDELSTDFIFSIDPIINAAASAAAEANELLTKAIEDSGGIDAVFEKFWNEMLGTVVYRNYY